MQGTWWYLIGDSPQGPVSTQALETMLQQGEMTRQSLVWKEGLSDWVPLAELPRLWEADAVQVLPALPEDLAPRDYWLWFLLCFFGLQLALRMTQWVLIEILPGFALWHHSLSAQFLFSMVFIMEVSILAWFFGPARRQMVITQQQDTWWFRKHGSLQGPVSMQTLDSMLHQGVVTPQSLVCREGLSHWLPMEQLSAALKAGNLQVDPESPLDLAQAGAWRRFLARMLDLWIACVPIALLGWLLLLQMPGFSPWFQRPASPFLLTLCLLPLALLAEAGIFARCGTTPGKALLGVVVLTLDGQRPTPAQYLRRQLGVFCYGLSMGLPLLSLVAMAAQGLSLQHGDPTPYDLNRFTVRQRRLSKTHAWVFGGIGALIAAMLLVELNQGL